MRTRSILLLLFALPTFALAQSPSGKPPLAPPNAPTLAVLLANRPAHIAQDQWLRMMQEPVNRSLYPLRVTQAMLDTLDPTGAGQVARQLDQRYQYVMVREENMPVVERER